MQKVEEKMGIAALVHRDSARAPLPSPPSNPGAPLNATMTTLIGTQATLPSGDSGTLVHIHPAGTAYLSLLASGQVVTHPLEGLILDPEAIQPPPAQSSLIDTAEAARLLNISQRTLHRRLTEAPPDLPGAPIDLSPGSRRRKLRWRADQVHVWAQALANWKHAQRHPDRPKKRRRTRHAPNARGGSLFAQALNGRNAG